MTRQPCPLLLSTTFALLCNTAAASNQAASPAFDEADYFASLPMLSAATRLSQRQSDLPAQVTLIDRAMIDASGAVNIVDLLRLVPGFQVYHVLANKFGVVSHGQGEVHPGRLEVMIDGRSVYSAIVSTVDWRTLGITLEDIDHIEVVHGPNVATHGANAFLGAINIVTRNLLAQRGTRLSLTGGELGTREYTLSSGTTVGNIELRGNLNFLKQDGTGTGFDRHPITREEGYTEIEDGGEVSQFALQGLYTPNLSDTVSFHLGLAQGGFGMGNIRHPLELADRDVDTNYQNLTWTRALDDGGQLKLQGYHNYTHYNQTIRQSMAYLFADAFDDPALLALTTVPPIPGLTDSIAGEDATQLVNLDVEEGSTHRYDLELEYSNRISSAVRFVSGVGWRLDRIQSQPQLNRSQYISEPFYRSFGNLEWQPNEQWTFNAGAMLEHNNLIGARLSPRLGANWHLSPTTTLRSSAAQAYRTPSLLDWYQFSQVTLPSNGATLDVVSATFEDLKPERIRSVDLGLLQRAPALQAALDLRLFYEEIDDALADQEQRLSDFGLSEVGSDQVFVNRNSAEWRNRGLDLLLHLTPREGTTLHFGYSYLSTEGSYDRGLDTTEQPDELAPRHTLSALASQQIGRGWSLSATFYRISKAKYFRGDDIAYSRFDARLAKTFTLGHSSGSVELIAQNLLDDYLEFERNNLFETRAFLRLKLQL